VTTLILVAGFGAMMTSPMPGIRLFAGLSALTLITALIGDLLIFPAMLVYASRVTRV
jgi:predicted RND superfamily exporter protein